MARANAETTRPTALAYPVLWLLVPLCAGMAFAYRATPLVTPYIIGYVAAALTALIVALIALAARTRRALSARAVATAAVAVCAAAVCTVLMATAIGRVRAEWPDEPQEYAVRVVSLPKTTRSTAVEAELLRGANAGKRIRLYLPDSVPVAVGRSYWIHARIESLRPSGNPYAFDLPAYMLTHGLSGTAYAPLSAPMADTDTGGSPSLWFLQVQQRTAERLEEGFSGRNLAMLAAMSVGDKRGLTSEVRSVFSDTGTSHLLALSGLHLGILFALWQLLVVRPLSFSHRWKSCAIVAGVALVWLYALVAGLPLSMQRAATMFTIAQLATLARRDTAPLDRLLTAALLLLLVSPLALFDVGFQLSFLSVASILVLLPAIPAPKSNRLLRALHATVCTSLCAWLGTLPLVAHYFHTVALYSLPANLVVVILATPILALTLLYFALPAATGLIVPCLDALLDFVSRFLAWVAALPGSTLTYYPTLAETALLLAALLCLALWTGRRNRTWLAAMAACLCMACGIGLAAHRPGQHGARLVFYNLWHGSALQAIRADGTSYLWTHGDGATESLQTTAADFWQAEKLPAPIPLVTARRDSALYFAPPLLSFSGKRVALLSDKQPRAASASPSKPSSPSPSTPSLPVDYLLVTKGYSGTPAHSLQRYTRGLVVLDASLGPIYRRLWHAAADSLHRPVHDMKVRGALVVESE